MSTDCELRGLDLLDAAIAHIEAYPETWHQEHWRCASGMCLAGHIATLAGGRWVSPATDVVRRAYLVPEPDDNPEDLMRLTSDGRGISAAARAERLLGFSADMSETLGPRDERDLFDGFNGLEEIKAIRNDLRAHLLARTGEPS